MTRHQAALAFKRIAAFEQANPLLAGKGLLPECQGAELARSLMPQSVRFTKRFFLSLPPGIYLASNVFGGPGLTPSFAEPVANSAAAKFKQWKRAVVAGAAQRTCHVFPNEGQFRQWLADIDCLRPPSDSPPNKNR